MALTTCLAGGASCGLGLMIPADSLSLLRMIVMVQKGEHGNWPLKPRLRAQDHYCCCILLVKSKSQASPPGAGN